MKYRIEGAIFCNSRQEAENLLADLKSKYEVLDDEILTENGFPLDEENKDPNYKNER